MNILILTSVYRDPSLDSKDRSTNVVNSFVKEWSIQGHNVVVIHNSHCFPRILYMLPKKINELLEARLGFPILDYEGVREKNYYDSGAEVFRLPIKKYIPHSKPSDKAINKQARKITNILSKNNFEPDVITGHWISPQIEILSKLKKIYSCRTAIVLHGTGYLQSKRFNAYDYLENIDVIGARSASQAVEIQKILELNRSPFICYSGIPNDYLEKYSLNLDKFEHIKEWNITFVGRLVGYKNIDSIINALSTIKTIKWKFNIVGDGGERTALEQLSKDLGCLDKVKFWNKVSRDTVMEILKDTHIFTMVSTNEVFGLVYLEAMAASCITIASENGGVDGIIVNEENGFLCPHGDSLELRNILLKIMTLNIEKIRNISSNAYMTVNEYSDSKVAKKYLQNIKESN